MSGYRMHSKTETTARLRTAGQLARRAVHAPRNARVEVGHRVVPQAIPSMLTTRQDALAACYAPDDDLDTFATVEEAGREDLVRKYGAVVHLYVSTRDGWGEWALEDVVVVWLGNGDTPPAIIDPRFVAYEA